MSEMPTTPATGKTTTTAHVARFTTRTAATVTFAPTATTTLCLQQLNYSSFEETVLALAQPCTIDMNVPTTTASMLLWLLLRPLPDDHCGYHDYDDDGDHHHRDDEPHCHLPPPPPAGPALPTTTTTTTRKTTSPTATTTTSTTTITTIVIITIATAATAVAAGASCWSVSWLAAKVAVVSSDRQ